jgi:hypothetical protein
VAGERESPARIAGSGGSSGGETMKQLARRASLVVVLLLTSVGTGSAECAWVLWEKRVAPARITWNVMYAYSKADGHQRKCTTDAKMFQDKGEAASS